MMSREFGLRLDAVDINNHFTLAKLAEWVAWKQAADGNGNPDKIAGPNPRLLLLQEKGAGKPIFILPQMMHFRSLAEELGTEQPVYAIQIKDHDLPPEVDSVSMEYLARLYIKLIRNVQPSGPYRLGGWCLWGWMAYEVARLLEEQGEVVEILMIVDALAPGFWERFSAPRQLLMKTAQFASRLAWLVVRLKRVGFAKGGKDRRRRLRALAISMSFNLPGRAGEAEFDTETARIEHLATQAARTYKPAAVKAHVLLFSSEVRLTGSFLSNDLGWGAVLGRSVHLNSLPGNHTEIFHPIPAGIMAGHVRKALGLKTEAASRA